MSDADLCVALLASDALALGELAKRYAASLVSVGKQYMGQREATELVVPIIYEAARCFQPGRGDFRGLLFTRYRDRCKDRLDLSSHRHETAVDFDGEGSVAEAARALLQAASSVDPGPDDPNDCLRLIVQRFIELLPADEPMRRRVWLVFCVLLKSCDAADLGDDVPARFKDLAQLLGVDAATISRTKDKQVIPLLRRVLQERPCGENGPRVPA